MHTVRALPPGLALPPIDALISGRPESCFEMPVQWSSGRGPIPVYIAQFDAAFEGLGDLFLFGARYDTAEALFDGAPVGEGHIVEYFLVQRATAAWRSRRLLQRGSVTYFEADEHDDHAPARQIDQAKLSLGRPPRWESKSEAVWPSTLGNPMLFVGQTRLPDNDVTRTLLTWDVTLYLFVLRLEGTDHFKLIEQNVIEQSAEDHFAQEEEHFV